MPDFGKIEPKFSDDDVIPTSEFLSAPVEEIQEHQYAQFAPEEMPAPKLKINIKRAVMLLLFIGIVIAAIAMLGNGLLQNKVSEVEKIAKIKPPVPTTFIDDNEPQNKLLKESVEAKNANVNVFNFDINKCLQQYSDDQCIDMYEKNLLVTEKK